MRLIGHIEDEKQARVFGDFLYVQGVENQVEHDDAGWAVWIHEEEELARGEKLLEEFRADAANPRFRAQARDAADLRAQAEKERAAYAKKIAAGRRLAQPLLAAGFGPDIQHGEIWRVWTPVLVHFGFLHLIFNLMWLRDLGGAIEWREGSRKFLWLVLVIAAVSNAAQYFVSGPLFGGLSGVVYGLLGYVWLRGRFDPASGYFLHPSTVTMMLIWFVLCFTGVLGGIANTVHAAGLATGCAWGWLEAKKHS